MYSILPFLAFISAITLTEIKQVDYDLIDNHSNIKSYCKVFMNFVLFKLNLSTNFSLTFCHDSKVSVLRSEYRLYILMCFKKKC